MNTLRELLKRLAQGGFDTIDGLAEGLGTNSREIGEMLAKLRELGYLEDLDCEVKAACSEGRSSCASCQGCRGCGVAFAGLSSGGRVWRLTPRGIKAAHDDSDQAADA